MLWPGVRSGRSGGGLLARVATGGLLCRHLRRISRRQRRCFGFWLLGLCPCKLQHLDGAWNETLGCQRASDQSAAETLLHDARPRRRQNRPDQEPNPTCQVPRQSEAIRLWEQRVRRLSNLRKAAVAPGGPGRPAPRRPLRLSEHQTPSLLRESAVSAVCQNPPSPPPSRKRSTRAFARSATRKLPSASTTRPAQSQGLGGNRRRQRLRHWIF